MPNRLERYPPFRIFDNDGFEEAILDHDQWLRENKHDKESSLWDLVVDWGEYEELKTNGMRYVNPETQFTHRRQQEGGTCLSTCLAILTTGLNGGERHYNDEEIIEEIRLKVNTGAPRTWSEFLHRNTGYRLAYCNTDHRQLNNYKSELIIHDDLFLVSWYSKGHEQKFEPNEHGSIGSSHVVIWWKDQIIDTNKDKTMHYQEYFKQTSNDKRAVKRIFRIVANWSIHRL